MAMLISTKAISLLETESVTSLKEKLLKTKRLYSKSSTILKKQC